MKAALRIAVLVVVAVLVGVGPWGAGEGRAMQASMPTTDVNTLVKRLESKTPPFVLDVREEGEFAQTHIKGAHLIPLGVLSSRLAEVPKDRPVVVVCRSGNRSARATQLLIEAGYQNVENLSGGMLAWSRSCRSDKGYC